MSDSYQNLFYSIQSPRKTTVKSEGTSIYYDSRVAPNGANSNLVRSIVGSNGEPVKGGSRIEYVPFQKKVIHYQERQYVERIPTTRKIIEYQQRVHVEQFPREISVTDYYAAESIKQYYKQVVPQKKVEMVPIQRKVRRVEYETIEKQIVHYPESQNYQQATGQGRINLQSQGVQIRPDAVYQPIDPQLIYKYSNNHKSNPVGYYQNGYKRMFSNTLQDANPLSSSRNMHSNEINANPAHNLNWINPDGHKFNSIQ